MSRMTRGSPSLTVTEEVNHPPRSQLLLKLRSIFDRRQSKLERLKEEAETLRQTKRPDEFAALLDEELERQKQEALGAMNMLKAEIHHARPSRADYPNTPEGKKALEEAEAAWMRAAKAAIDTSRTWIQFFQSIVEQATHMLHEVDKANKKAPQTAYQKVQDFLEWFAHAIRDFGNKFPKSLHMP